LNSLDLSSYVSLPFLVLILDFCEHMCFLGSVKYPGENEYKSYLAQHGGHSNASTSMHFTTYKFDVLAEHAERAIDIFANFFVAPLFTVSGTSREVLAVDSENSKNLSADVRRRLQVLKDFGDPEHYYTKFSTGNASTLPTQTPEQLEYVRDALLALHRKHYRPENLTVVIAGPQSLCQLQEWIVSRFAPMHAQPFPLLAEGPSIAEQLVENAAQDIPSYHYKAPEVPFRSPFHPLTSKNKFPWPVLITNKPVRSMRKLVLMFPVPSTYKVPDRSPISLLSHLLGHEGPHSSFAILQNLGWVNSLSAGSRASSPDFTLFQIEISLTDNGEKHWKDVVNMLFQHCQLIVRVANEAKSKINGEDKNLARIWHEKAQLASLFFHQTSPGDVYSFVPSLCNSIVLYGTRYCLSAGSMLAENASTFPYEPFAEFAKLLVPTNCFIERCSDGAWNEMEDMFTKSDDELNVSVEKLIEPWYGVDYFMSQVDVKSLHNFTDASALLALPSRNDFIPQSLELCDDLPPEAKAGPRIDKEIDPPKLIVRDERVGCLWHRLDDRYALPKSSLTLLIRNAATNNIKEDSIWQYDSNAAVHSTLLNAMFMEALAQETYDATLAGLNWNLSLSARGVKLSCSGFSSRLPDLALKVLDSFLADHFLKESYFLSAKDRLLRSLRTYFESSRADSQALYYRDFLLSSVDLGLDEAIKRAEETTLESLKAHHTSLLVNTEAIVDCLFSGNVSESAAKLFFASVSEKLTLQSAFTLQDSTNMWYPGSIERRIAPGTSIELHFASRNSEEKNGSVLVTYQSDIPGYRGPNLSSDESLRSSAAIRLLCHILREPLFNELRTKQTLGYIVSSYYDNATSSAPHFFNYLPQTASIDFIVISILSQKLSPPEVLKCIDDFLLTFRQTLSLLSNSEVQDYASALSTALLKPIQKLNIEASLQFSKVQSYGPELNNSGAHIPWDNSKAMAGAIWALDRNDLLHTWDRMIHPRSHARIVSCVYGTTFPLDRTTLRPPCLGGSKPATVASVNDIIKVRKQLPVYNHKMVLLPRTPLLSGFYPKSALLEMPFLKISPTSIGLALFGVGIIATGWGLLRQSKKAI
jgi:insulysin